MCQFNFSFSGEAESLIEKAKQAIEGAGGVLTGSAAEGNFTAKTVIGSIHGYYTIKDRVIYLVVTKKPLLLTCSRIEKELTAVMQ